MVSTESRSWRQGQSTQRVCPAGLPHGMFHHHWIYKTRDHPKWASQVVLGVQNAPAKAGDIRDMSLIPGLGRSPGGGHANPLQHSCLENPMDRGVWKATVLGVTKSGHRMKHTHCPRHHSWNVHYTAVGSLRARKCGRNQHKFSGHLFSIKRMKTQMCILRNTNIQKRQLKVLCLEILVHTCV